MRTEEYKLNLWNEFMKHTNFISQNAIEMMGMLAGCYVKKQEFLFQVYKAFIENERYLEDEENEVYYERDGKNYILSYKGKECVFGNVEFKKTLVVLLDILEDTLPLGSVVDLKKSAYKDVARLQEIEYIRLVITHRFLGSENEKYFFPYAGVIYPTGMLGRKEVIYFTRSLVENIVYRGYRDQKEDAFVYLMKRELIIEKEKNSYGYASEKEIEDMNRKRK